MAPTDLGTVPLRLGRRRWTVVGLALSAAVSLFVLGPFALRCGLYLDDPTFLLGLQDGRWDSFKELFLGYVPGRNLQILWWAVFLKVSGTSFPAMHAWALGIECLNTLLAFLLVWRLTRMASVALPSAVAYAVIFNHGHTHFWLSAVLQVQLSIVLLLSAFLAASHERWSLRLRLSAGVALFLAGVFTYDQPYFLWPLLLACAWWASRSPRAGLSPYLAAGAVCLAGNAAHVLLRYLSPVSIGGRPLVHFGQLGESLRKAVVASQRGTFALPLWPPQLPHPGWTAATAAAALVGGWVLLRVHRRMLVEDRSERPEYYLTLGPLRLALFGVAWWLLSYLPNLFNYVSPWHNHLPAFGWVLFWISLLGWLGSRYQVWRAALPVAGVVWFAIAVVANVHEGSEWVRSARLHSEFLGEAAKIPGHLENIFVVGAPREFKRAPVFVLPHDCALAAAWARGQGGAQGSTQLSPTRDGGFFQNDLLLSDAHSFIWLPYEEMNAVGYGPADGFRCLRAFRLRLPDGAILERPLRGQPACSSERTMDVDTAIVAAEDAGASSAGGLGSRVLGENPAGLRLTRASADVRPGFLELTLIWAVDAPFKDRLAILPFIRAADGRDLYTPFYPSKDPRGTSLVWPLLDEIRPASSWAAGRSFRQTFHLRTPAAIPAGRHRLVLETFRLKSGNPPLPAGSVQAELDVD